MISWDRNLKPPYGLVNTRVGGAHKMAGQLPMCFISLIDIERLVIEP
jgi:hypothetical protein